MDIKTMVSLIANNDPIKVFNDLYINDEEFRGFIENNKGVSTQEMINRYGIRQLLIPNISHEL